LLEFIVNPASGCTKIGVQASATKAPTVDVQAFKPAVPPANVVDSTEKTPLDGMLLVPDVNAAVALAKPASSSKLCSDAPPARFHVVLTLTSDERFPLLGIVRVDGVALIVRDSPTAYVRATLVVAAVGFANDCWTGSATIKVARMKIREDLTFVTFIVHFLLLRLWRKLVIKLLRAG
jgi:hypothetical protein